MIKKFVTRPLLLVSVLTLVIMVVAFFAASIATHAAPTQVNSTSIPVGQSNIAQAPGTGKLAHYSPKTLSCTHQNGKTCITIKNTTKSSQSVTLKGSVVYTLTPGQVQAVVYTSAGTYIYSLSSNPKATLTVTVS